ncbi:RICIN domain-containing protein [Micromonospora krabiensis]|uniref:serine/threonine protein kinase n=1 Tax=Micromonospora krabiensis TaxID=307121 RepID=UPI0012FD11FE|nr:serine/threonine protein kinase [Micromonospora krabiensis]
MSGTSPQLIANRYRLVRPLGQGGMGRVWQARDEMLERDVAIKELVAPAGLRDEERRDLRERSLREARAVARLDHVNVVRVFDVLHSDDDPWIVMELVASRSLHQALEAEGPMPPARVARIGLGVLAALRAAHGAGILHRDVKPANVLLADDGRVVLTDFGLATLPGDPRVTQTGMVLGSPAFLAPERATDGAVGPAADLWSLGATLYAAVEGRTPYHRSTPIATLAALATEAPPPPQRAGVLTELLDGLLRRDPQQRIDAGEADRLLRTAAADPAGTIPPNPAGLAGTVPPGLAGAEVGSPTLDAPVTRVGSGETPRPLIVPEFRSSTPNAPADAGGADRGVVGSVGTVGGGGAAAGTVDVLPARAPDRRRRSWLVGSLAAALLLAGAVGASLRYGGLPGTATDNPAAQLPSPTALADTPVSRVLPPPPAGWHYHRDDPRFLVPVPDGWVAERDGERTEFREPDGGRVLVVGEVRTVPANPTTELRAREKAERKRYDGYRQVRLGAVPYQVRAAEWEWTYDGPDGTPRHAVNRLFVGNNGHAYTLGWTTPAAEWSTSRSLFTLITDGFQGLPLAGAPSRSADAPPSSGPGQPTPGRTGAEQPSPGTGDGAPSSPRQSTASSSPNAPTGKPIVGFASDRCIDVPGGKATSGVQLQIWDCRRTAGQLWTFPSDGTVRALGKCLDVAGHSTSDGAAVLLADCTGAASQKFTLNKAYDLVNVRADRCVDVFDHHTENGSPLQIWQCTGEAHQKWKLG